MRTYDKTKKSLADIIRERNRPSTPIPDIEKVEESPKVEEIRKLIDVEDISAITPVLDYVLLPKALYEKFSSLVESGDIETASLVFKDSKVFTERYNWSLKEISSIVQDCLDMSYNDFINAPLSERENHPHMRILKLLLLTRRARQFASFYPLPPLLETNIPNEQIFNPYQFEKDLLKVVHYSFIPDKRNKPNMHHTTIRKIIRTARGLHAEGFKCIELTPDKTMSGKTELIYLDAEKMNEPMVTL